MSKIAFFSTLTLSADPNFPSSYVRDRLLLQETRMPFPCPRKTVLSPPLPNPTPPTTLAALLVVWVGKLTQSTLAPQPPGEPKTPFSDALDEFPSLKYHPKKGTGELGVKMRPHPTI